MSVFTPENPAFIALLKYGGLLLAKLLAMSPFTGLYRYAKKSVASREDAIGMVGNDEEKIKRLLEKNPDVERVRSFDMQAYRGAIMFKSCHRSELLI